MTNKLKKTDSKGFTIIEVMIVLAIAGLILLIVFLAVPALQRNSRNTQRKADSAHIGSLIGEYESNNNGKVPATVGTSGTVDLNIGAPENFSIIDTSKTTITVATSTTSFATAPSPDTVLIYENATCSNATTPQYDASKRSVVVWYGIEGKTTSQCLPVGS